MSMAIQYISAWIGAVMGFRVECIVSLQAIVHSEYVMKYNCALSAQETTVMIIVPETSQPWALHVDGTVRGERARRKRCRARPEVTYRSKESLLVVTLQARTFKKKWDAKGMSCQKYTRIRDECLMV